MRPTQADQSPKARRWIVARPAVLLLEVVCGLTAPALRSQALAGIEVREVSAYAAYYSKSLPAGGALAGNLPSLLSDFSAGASAQVGWSMTGERSAFSLMYMPSYVGRVRYSSWSGLNHSLSLRSVRTIAPRWKLNVAGDLQLSTIEQAVFAPTAYSTAAEAPISFDDLAAAMLSRTTTTPEAASLLDVTSLRESPARSLVYGSRMMTAGLGGGFSYSYSPRLLIAVTANANRIQRVSDQLPATSVIPDTTSAGTAFVVSYSLSPCSQIGARVSTERVSSPLRSTFTTRSTVSLGRTFAGRWITEIRGGAARVDPIRRSSVEQTALYPTPSTLIFGASLGFKTAAHAFVASYDQTPTDPYGLGAGRSSLFLASWKWRRPRSSWWIEVLGAWENSRGNLVAELSGWRTFASLGRALSSQTAVTVGYGLLHASGGLNRSAHNLSQSAIRLSVSWKAAQ